MLPLHCREDRELREERLTLDADHVPDPLGIRARSDEEFEKEVAGLIVMRSTTSAMSEPLGARTRRTASSSRSHWSAGNGKGGPGLGSLARRPSLANPSSAA